MTQMKFTLTQSAVLLLTPEGNKVKVTVLEKDFKGSKKEELDVIELLASMGLRKTKNLSYRAGFTRMVLAQHPAENGTLDTAIKLRVSHTFGSETGYKNMNASSETAEIL